MEAVDVFVGPHALLHDLGVETFGERQLHENAVGLVAFVQAIDLGDQLVLADIGRQSHRFAGDANLLAVARLARDVDLRGGVVTDEDDRESRWPVAIGDSRRHLGGDFFTNLACNVGAVEPAGAALEGLVFAALGQSISGHLSSTPVDVYPGWALGGSLSGGYASRRSRGRAEYRVVVSRRRSRASAIYAPTPASARKTPVGPEKGPVFRPLPC